MKNVRLVGWRPGVKTVSLVEAIMKGSTGSLVTAKRLVDQLLDGEEIVLTFNTPEEAARFRSEADRLGAVVE